MKVNLRAGLAPPHRPLPHAAHSLALHVLPLLLLAHSASLTSLLPRLRASLSRSAASPLCLSPDSGLLPSYPWRSHSLSALLLVSLSLPPPSLPRFSLPLPFPIPVANGLGVGSPNPPCLSTLSIALSLSRSLPSQALRSNFTLTISLIPARFFCFSSPNFSLALSCTLRAFLVHSSHFSPARELPVLVTLAALPSNSPRSPSLCPSHAVHPSYASILFQGTWLAARPLRPTSLATWNDNTLNSSYTR